MRSARGASGSVLETLLAMLVSDKLGDTVVGEANVASRTPALEATRTPIRHELLAGHDQ